MNEKILIIIGFVAILITGFLYFEFSGEEKPENTLTIQKGLVIFSPKSNEEVSFPIKITGYVNGDGWIGFEGQVGTVELKLGGVAIDKTILQATSEWTSLPIYFQADFPGFMVDCAGNSNCTISGPADLVFHNENPSGLEERNKEFVLPVVIKSEELQTVMVYFNNDSMDPEFSCNKVFAVKRTIQKTEGIARATLEELLKGPTEPEKSQGFFSNINQGVKIQSLNIDREGTARVDFDEQLEFQVGGSCKVAAIRAEISQTLKQFSSIKDVIISINGRTEDILQP